MRIATPSSCRTSTDYSLPVSPVLRNQVPHVLDPLFRAAIENCGIGAIPIDEINGAVGLPSKCEIPDERSVRKLTQGMRLEAIALWLRVQKLANTTLDSI